MGKKCNKCLLEKDFTEFHRHKSQKDGFNTICKECRKLSSKKYYAENVGIISEKRKKRYYENHEESLFKNNDKTEEQRLNHRIRSSEYAKKNYEKVKEYQKKYYQKNKEKIIKRSCEWCKKNLEHCYKVKNDRTSTRKKEDVIFRIKRKFRTDIYISIKRSKRNKRIEEILGISFEEFKIYIERMFEPWMNWGNWGLHTWHIDHIIPLSSAKTEDEVYSLWYYKNLRPISAEENLKKGSKLIK